MPAVCDLLELTHVRVVTLRLEFHGGEPRIFAVFAAGPGEVIM
jgi:hypothetical protein